MFHRVGLFCEPQNGIGSVLVLTLLAVLLAATPIRAQVTSSISGTVKDRSKAVIPGATLTVTSVETGATRVVSTDDAGLYRVLSLPIGQYQIKVEKPGFEEQIRQGITLSVAEEAVVDFALDIGQVTQSVTVTSEAPLVNTTTSETAGLVDEREVKELPLNGRSFDNLITLNPATVNFTSIGAPEGSGAGGNANSFVIAGRRPQESLFLLNGIEYAGGGQISTIPGSASDQLLGIDAIREYNVITSAYGAEYGKRPGGQISIVTMSGSNQLHGTLFEFLRNSDLDARNYFDLPTIPLFQRNNFGGSAGGPIKKDKTFIFANYEGLRQRLGESSLVDVPDVNAKNGLLPCSVVTPAPKPCPASGLVNVGVAPGIAPYFVLWPAPNGPDLGNGTAQYFSSPKQSIRDDFGTLRVDQDFSSKDTLSGVYTIDDGVNDTPTGVNFVTPLIIKNQVLSLAETHLFSPQVINTATFGFSRGKALGSVVPTIPIPLSLSLVAGDTMGDISITNGPGAGGPTVATSVFRNIFTYEDGVQLEKGRHLISIGGWFQDNQSNENASSLKFGEVIFPSFQSFLQGNASTFEAVPNPTELGWRTKEAAWYVQDTIKVISTLTLSLGLRDEFTNGWNEAHGEASNIDPGPPTPQVPFGILMTNPVIGNSVFNQNNALKLFSPRLGLAWTPFGSQKTSVRAGWGIYYNLMDELGWVLDSNPPFNTRVSLSNVTFPAQFTPGVSLPSAQVSPGGVNPDLLTPTVIQYMLDIQQQISSSTALTIGYRGSHGYHNYISADVNPAIPVICPASPCPAGLPSGTPYFPLNAPYANPVFANARNYESWGVNYYNALVVDVTHRLSHDVAFRANYTFSKSMDNSSADTLGQAENAPQDVLDPYNPRADIGLSSFNIKHRLSANVTYNLPIGNGKTLLRDATGAIDKLLGGWQVNSIINVQSGFPWTPQLGFNQSRDGDVRLPPDRASWNPSFTGPLVLGSPQEWFNPNAFILPPAGTYGNTERNSIPGPGLAEVDLSLFKNINISERLHAQFRAEGFNVFNRANWGNMHNTVLNSNGTVVSDAGEITSTSTTSRQMQFGLKLIF